MPDMNQLCLTCGYTYGEHSDIGEHCPKNGGSPINRKFEWFNSCFNAAPTEADQLRAEVARLTAGIEAMQRDAANNTITIKMLMAQLAELKAPIEDIKIYCNNPSAWDYYDETVSEKIRAILKAAGMA